MLLLAPTASLGQHLWGTGLLMVFANNMSRYLNPAKYPNAWGRRQSASVEAKVFAYYVHKSFKATWVDTKTVQLGGRRALRLVLVGRVSGKEEVFIPYVLSTRTHVYTLMYMAPGKSIAASTKYRAECDALVDAFTFQP